MGGVSSLAAVKNVDTIPKRVQYWSDFLPDRELFVFYNGDIRESYTSRQVLQMAGKFASRLRREYGFQKGDIIVNTLPNSPERLFTDLGITLAGCICLNGAIMFSDGSEFLTAARNSRLSAVVVCPTGNTPAWKILKPYIVGHPTSLTADLKCNKAPEMKSAVLVSRHPDGGIKPFIKDLQDSKEDIFVETNIRPDDIMYVFTTSGSTGYCKLVSRTHTDIIETWTGPHDIITQQSHHVWKDNVHYNDRPIGWMGGFPFGTYVNADTRVLLDVFDTLSSKVGADVWHIICREKADYAIIMPLDLGNILNRKTNPEPADYKLKLIICGGQPIRKNQFQDYFAVAEEVAVLYGSTEASFMSLSIIEEKDGKDYFCGQLMPGIQMRIVDEDGRECKTGQVGTIHAKGKGIFKGYLNRVENPDPKTLTAFTKDGWLNLDDSGYFDENRNVYVLGRLKDVIIFGATFVYPSWLEPKIVEHPEVAEACIVPVSDPVLYHNICAIVQPAPGSDINEEQLRTFCKNIFAYDKDVEGIPVPKFYLIMEHLPKTSTGKVDRALLQTIAEKKFGSR